MRNLKQTKGKNGELQVTLWKNGKSHKHDVSRLVAEAFIPNPENLPYVEHINGDKTDNRAINLRWTDKKPD